MKKIWKLNTFVKGYYLDYSSYSIKMCEYILAFFSLFFTVSYFISYFIYSITSLIIYSSINLNFFSIYIDLELFYYICNIQVYFLINLYYHFFSFKNPIIFTSILLIMIAYIFSIKKRVDKNDK